MNISPQTTQPIGIVIVDKPQGITSHGVISRLRRALGEKKIGHAGTLDPMATGLILAGVGPMTRFLTYLVGLDKVYEATIRLGASSSTDDAEGEIQPSDASRMSAQNGETLLHTLGIDQAELERTIKGFLGDIEQVPSAVSAIKVDGKRAYQRVRDGEQVELKPRTVTIYQYDLLDLTEARDLGTVFLDLRVRVHCSSGTYIRALARDLGSLLGCGGHLTELRRTHIGPLNESEAVAIDDISRGSVLSPVPLAKKLFSWVEIDDTEQQHILHGRSLALDEEQQRIVKRDSTAPSLVAAVNHDRLVAMLRPKGQTLKPETVFGRGDEG